MSKSIDFIVFVECVEEKCYLHANSPKSWWCGSKVSLNPAERTDPTLLQSLMLGIPATEVIVNITIEKFQGAKQIHILEA